MNGFALDVLLHWVAVGVYLVGALLFGHAVVFGHPKRVVWARWVVLAGMAPHAVAIVHRWVAVGHGPYMLKYEVLSSNAFIALAFLQVLLLARPRWGALGLVVVPVAILAIALGLFSDPRMRDLPPSLRSIWLIFHITFAKFSAGAFLLSLASSVVLLLKGGARGGAWLEALPPADELDAYTVRFVGFGFIFWTVTVAAGAIWAHQSWGRYWGWDAIETWSLITWLVYGTFLHLRVFFRIGARASAWAAIAAFAVFILTLAILPFLLPSLHSAYFQ